MTTVRRVRQLRITAPRDDLARRGAHLVEDALRTATLPSDSRMFVVRSLRLGEIRTSVPSAGIARRVEQQLADITSRAVHALNASAASADVIYFRDELECIVALATRIALQQSTSAWFWRLAVPAWRQSMSRDQALRALLFASMNTEAKVVGSAELVHTLHERRALQPLLSALRVSDVAQLMQAAAWPLVPLELLPTREVELPHTAMAPIARLYATQWTPSDIRAIWLACALLAAERPARAMDHSITRVAARILAPVQTKSTRSGESRESSRNVDSARKPVDASTRTASVLGAPIAMPSGEITTITDMRQAKALISHVEWVRVPTNQGADADAPTSIAATTSPRPDEATAIASTPIERAVPHFVAAERVRTDEPSSDPQRTRTKPALTPSVAEQSAQATASEITQFGGLFLILPVLSRLGIESYLRERPSLIEQSLPMHILRYSAMRLGIRDNDPSLVSFAKVDEQDRPSRREVITWAAAARRWCAEQAEISMRSLVRRPAHIASTRTHIDVHFRLSDVDLRIRRVGLDIDPGWLPWFGRVVRFHYHPERGGSGD